MRVRCPRFPVFSNFALRTCVFAILLLAIPSPTEAHQSSTGYVSLDLDGRDATLTIRLASEDLGEPSGFSPLIVPTRSQFERHEDHAAQYVSSRVHIALGAVPCPLGTRGVAITGRDADRYDATFAFIARCPRQIDTLTLHDDLFFDVDPRHQALVTVRAFGTTRQHVLRTDHRDVVVLGEPSRLAQGIEYATLGIEHILTGYDHLAFLLALLVLAAARPRREGLTQVLAVVTAFTVAHSITLALAVSGLVRLPSRFVESAIAASIAYVAIENIVRPAARVRWPLTFAFGLVHGLGFASALAETGLPARGTALALVSFNIGVEFGQLAMVALVFPMLRALHEAELGPASLVRIAALALGSVIILVVGGASVPVVVLLAALGIPGIVAMTRRLGYERAVQRGVSMTIAAFAIWWLVERLAGHVWLGGRLG